ncbi:MAG: CDP-alcohol phosphatidyltransferase family protein [Alphaproteobacteria bacterium]|nr:CDP-alcohol phosphatidyltransferase family protein [Alphaproteobacteria bacterium]MDA8003692.1 CDP-alcohol phosphatidyltransferase family protein [Alphaproteobacteria bacterium]MDA8005748.1 CDP-alcohol phosphatidyltransferase family protein [Alphaproteobacteria bacterium]MDA8013103.1 CDP-alcohol phosphatidyltransferase family protein [Alphaproteobacteria bacterium]
MPVVLMTLFNPPKWRRISANDYTLARLWMAPVVAVLVLIPGLRVVAAVLFLVAAFTDFLDGLAARRQGAESLYGAWLDPVADKILVLCVLIALLGTGEIGGWNSLAVVVLVLREIGVTGLRAYLAMIENPGDPAAVAAPADTPDTAAPADTADKKDDKKGDKQPLASSHLAKVKTSLQLGAIFFILVAPLVMSDGVRVLGLVLLWVSAAAALQSGWQYLCQAREKMRLAS